MILKKKHCEQSKKEGDEVKGNKKKRKEDQDDALAPETVRRRSDVLRTKIRTAAMWAATVAVRRRAGRSAAKMPSARKGERARRR